MRYLVGLSAALTLFMPIAGAAPKVKEEKPIIYHPVEVGIKRVYKDGKAELVDTVTSVERLGSVIKVAHETRYPSGSIHKSVFLASAKGLFQAVDGSETFDPPACLLALPVAPKATWEFEFAAFDERRKAQVTFLGEEMIEVPAGKYKAIRVQIDYPITKARQSRWYAPGIGLVREAYETKGVGLTQEGLTLESVSSAMKEKK